ncbi:DUF1800 domain-containing protein [Chiayiivirga flava]|uniref:Uncharacterized protein (DUF1800 family) n=1 Tax=Chiayiivirga flava TaxID=659595 RepID=A0A7W8FY79_9GAMM|nr:DUF1800 domain-containing protein [Chiayiivirga flava]MBB5206826.1 uncharacterized protein (DUF1800 family) [Chiayiivirga flava]
MHPIQRLAALAFALLLAAAPAIRAQAGGTLLADGFESGPGVARTAADASRFLQQATFGATEADIAALQGQRYADWIDAQLALPMTPVLDYMKVHDESPADPAIDFWVFTQAWFDNALSAPDQLRQRVAFALSQILVVSERGNNLANDGLVLGAYYDILLRNGLGNYRDLLQDVTLSPAMGRFLSMYRNRKPDPANNIRPDENFAREVLQLFSLGLVKLNRDGTPLIVGGDTVPTYDEQVVRGFAHVFTGWGCEGFEFENAQATCSTEAPMRAFEAYHDRSEKHLFDGIVLPANRDAAVDLDAALDAIFAHPNLAPFVSRQLIQRLVTSNPSPQYIDRVAAVFENDGNGERGNLAAVVRAILLDDEARLGHVRNAATFGKVREPLLRLTQVWRGLDVSWLQDRMFPDDIDIHLRYNQSPLAAPSVFNFFSPSYTPGGALGEQGLVAPELQAITDTFAIALTNDQWGRIFWQCHGCYMNAQQYPGVRETQLDSWRASIADGGNAAIDAMIERANVLFLGGGMSPALRSRVRARVLEIPADDPMLRVQNALYLIAASPEFAVQR